MEQIWARLQETFKEKLGVQNYDIWIRPIQISTLGPRDAVLIVPNRYYRDWVQANYAEILVSELEQVMGSPVRLHFEIARAEPEELDEIPEPLGEDEAPDAPALPIPGVALDKTFDNFVVGASNQFAHAAATAVCDSPGDPGYNPLFIYGSTGLGKTHLMYAVANRVRQLSPESTVVYVTAEQFTNEMINALRFHRMPEFRDRYRKHPHFLLMDDVQFLSGKDRTQEELFHTFEWLRERGRQIVFTADVLPREIKMFEPRLRTRCEGGMLADVQPPDMETLLAILHQKAEVLGLDVPPDLARYIGTRVRGSVRELEGVLNRLRALTQLHREPLTVDFARRTLGAVLAEEPASLSNEAILQCVASFYNMKVSDLKGQRRLKQLVRPRHVAMYLVRRHTELSFPEIGRLFGNRDHATVQHACKKIASLLSKDVDLRNAIQTLERSIGR